MLENLLNVNYDSEKMDIFIRYMSACVDALNLIFLDHISNKFNWSIV